MPIEIKELNIKINVEDKNNSSETNESKADLKDSIIKSCVEQVMEILSQAKER
ncbi:MAG: hypothetical protein HQ541_18135 [Mariniphaga sp.]|nr:hypothetical protein [Mariniphaga sp.]